MEGRKTEAVTEEFQSTAPHAVAASTFSTWKCKEQERRSLKIFLRLRQVLIMYVCKLSRRGEVEKNGKKGVVIRVVRVMKLRKVFILMKTQGLFESFKGGF